MKLSAHALARRESCERRFVLEFVYRLHWPAPESEPGLAAAAQGQAFHRLVQRWRLGMPVAPSGHLAGLWDRFVASPFAQGAARSWIEQVLQFSLPGAQGRPVPFLVRFDEVRRELDGTWTILDWKTGSRRPEGLADSWQTRLYRFALAEAGAVFTGGERVPPEGIKLVYWLVSTGEGLVLPYDRARFEADRRALEAIALSLATQLASASGPVRPDSCRSCPFHTFCQTPDRPLPPDAPLILPTFTR